MLQTEFRRTLWFEISELPEVIIEAPSGQPIVSRPQAGFTARHAAGRRHVLVVIRRAADHVPMRFDIPHGYLAPGYAPHAALVVAAGIGSVVGSLNASNTFSARLFV